MHIRIVPESEMVVVVVVVVVVVECCCFLINIIDENIETLPLLPRSISVQKTNGFARWRREVS